MDGRLWAGLLAAQLMAHAWLSMQYIVARLLEPSTWRGIISLLTLAGLKIAPEQADAVLTAGVSVYSAVNIFRRENK